MSKLNEIETLKGMCTQKDIKISQLKSKVEDLQATSTMAGDEIERLGKENHNCKEHADNLQFLVTMKSKQLIKYEKDYKTLNDKAVDYKLDVGVKLEVVKNGLGLIIGIYKEESYVNKSIGMYDVAEQTLKQLEVSDEEV